MKITFLGTGAADWDWKNLPPGTRKSTCTLIGASSLVDAGPCVLQGLADAGVSPANIRDLLITHSHTDHFNIQSISAIASASKKRKLRIWAPPTALDALADQVEFEPHPLIPGSKFTAAGLQILALPANHAVEKRPNEQPLNFVFANRSARLLYALDGAWLTTKARLALRSFLDAPLDAVVWDATSGNTFHDFRFAEHNDLKMIAYMRTAMLGDGLIAPDTIHIFNHIARTLWPKSHSAQKRLADRFEGILANDGLTFEIQ